MLIIDIHPEQFIIARKLLKLTQNDIAEQIHMAPINYANIENSKSDPKLSNFRKIIDFFRSNGIDFHNDGNVSLNLKKE